ncbi:sulfate ABC transporter substrate-binding protein, partial [Streptomyces sp. NPDC004244]
KELDAGVLDPAWKSILVTDDPLAATLKAQADYAVKARLIEQPDLAGIYDLTLLNKVLKEAGKPEVADAGLGAK